MPFYVKDGSPLLQISPDSTYTKIETANNLPEGFMEGLCLPSNVIQSENRYGPVYYIREKQQGYHYFTIAKSPTSDLQLDAPYRSPPSNQMVESGPGSISEGALQKLYGSMNRLTR
jgi:hypothetical protein